MIRTLFIVGVLAATAIGCTRVRSDSSSSPSPFQEEETRYTLAYVFDFGPRFRELSNGPTGLRYALDIKDIFFRDRSEPTDRLLLAQTSSIDRAVLWDGKPRTFKKEFANPEKDLRDFLNRHADASKGPNLHAYDSVADTFDYLLKFRSRKAKTAVLVFSEMKDNSPAPATSRKHLVDSLAAYSRAGGHCAFYWLSWETTKEMEAIGKEAGLTWSYFIPEAVRDPIRPTFGE